MKVMELREVWKTYPKGASDVQALRGVSLKLEAGESVALVGPSGSGKSTLLYLMGLMDTPSQGEVRIGGQNPARLGDRARSRLRGGSIGFVFQSYNLLPQLKAWQNVALPLKYAGVGAAERRTRALAMLERVGLAERAAHFPNELSGGQEQRVAIARALVNKPRLVLADEPTGNLDTATRDEVLDMLISLNEEGTTLVIVTHDPEVAARARRQLHLEDGRLR